MTQTSKLLQTLKKCLRAKGLNYRDVATTLKLSEASVKRLFAEQSFSLKRLEDVCSLLDMSIYDLTKLTHNRQDTATILSYEQEDALAQNPILLTYFYLLLNGWEPVQIEQVYTVEPVQAIKLLTTLDKLHLIDLYPENKVRLRTARTISWRRDGPVWQLYQHRAKLEFLHSDFAEAEETLGFATAQLSATSVQILQHKSTQLLQDFDELAEADINLPLQEKRSFGLMLALRPWVFSVFTERKR